MQSKPTNNTLTIVTLQPYKQKNKGYEIMRLSSRHFGSPEMQKLGKSQNKSIPQKEYHILFSAWFV